MYHYYHYSAGSTQDDDDDGGGHHRALAGHDGSDARHVRLSIDKYEGDMYYLSAHLHAPIKLVPPYGYLSETDWVVELQLCNLEEGDHYLGLRGGESCAVYDVLAEEFTGECHELDHHGTTSDTARASELRVDHFIHSHVEAGGYADFYVYVDEAHSHDNLILEMVRGARPRRGARREECR